MAKKGKKLKVLPSFAATGTGSTSAKVKKEQDGEHVDVLHRHINANKRLKAELVPLEVATPIELNQSRTNSSRSRTPNMVFLELDPSFPSKYDSPSKLDTATKKTKIFYHDTKGIKMEYPTDTEHVRYVTRPLKDLTIVKDHEDEYNFKVILGHPKEEKTERTFVMLKVSKFAAGINKTKMEVHHFYLQKLLATMPTVRRGGMRTGVESKYVCFGHRKNPLDRENGEYSFSKAAKVVSKEEQQEIKVGIENLVHQIEHRGMECLKRASMEGHGSDGFARVQQKFDLPSISSKDGVATQLALAKEYCSPVHVDNDFYYSTLSVYDDKAPPNQVLYHFCFPTYGIAIPMVSGDIIVFNPLVPHCATNPRLATALIYSLYVSNKTCNTHITNWFDNFNTYFS